MAQVTKGFTFSLGGTSYTDQIESVTFNPGENDQESTPATVSGTTITGRKVNAGLLGASVTIDVADDTSFTLTKYLFANADSEVDCIVRFTNAVVGATNPQISGPVLLKRPPFTVGQGEVLRYSVTLPFSADATDTAGFTYATA